MNVIYLSPSPRILYLAKVIQPEIHYGMLQGSRPNVKYMNALHESGGGILTLAVL